MSSYFDNLYGGENERDESENSSVEDNDLEEENVVEEETAVEDDNEVECDKETLAKFNELKIEEESEKTDPKWDQLKNIKFNNN